MTSIQLQQDQSEVNTALAAELNLQWLAAAATEVPADLKATVRELSLESSRLASSVCELEMAVEVKDADLQQVYASIGVAVITS